MSKKSRAQKRRSRESQDAPSSSADHAPLDNLTKTQKRKLQKKRHKQLAAAVNAEQRQKNKKQQAVTSNPTTSLGVVYEDQHMIAINKPAGLLAHGSHAAMERGTVVHALSARARVAGYSPIGAHMLEARQSQTGEADSFIPRAIVHRLDRGTTGLMLIAKSELAEQQASATRFLRIPTRGPHRLASMAVRMKAAAY